ncbi:Pet127-domain-containing protein [Macrolepiota fuliginosa MF-IS2]|uniref:Pet127-domain-containing protein n=1 Tax=Macrolepiota fuliginosa MF-IS2 TaxID=1400762 RepID=A0A9P5XPU8_9AGAR|nr:Pet127-domain-containing protein [Macrolepiota fuliginosa MF-IS2]
MYIRRIEGVIEPDKMPSLEDVAPTAPQLPVAQLKHSLERVLFNPGVHWLQDPRSRVYNFDPYVQEIPAVTDFAFERVTRFTASSQDTELHTLAAQENKLFSGSTSSLTPILCHIYFLLSGDRFVDTSMLSMDFQSESRRFTPGQRMPASVQFNYKDGRYAVDTAGEKNGESDKNILAWMGTMLEKFLTVPKEEFETYKRSNVDGPLPEKKTMREAFRFAKARNFLLRSQLDCHDPRLPGTGVFDIKTRACMAIRLDIFNYEENSGYLIRKQYGKFESFEREYYDLLRSAFLKYQFQARIGNMDGVIVAYHNTKQMFGFQYISLEEMDLRLFGYGQGDVGQRVFKGCLGIMEHLAEEIVNCFPNQSVQATFETQEGTQKMDVWVEPLKWDGPEEERPMKQLEVRTWSYLDSVLARRRDALRGTNCGMETGSIRWSIAHLNQDSDRARSAYFESKRRQFRAWTVPTGVDADGLQEWYNGLDFGGSGDPDRTVSFNPERFKIQPDRGLSHLRRLSERGRQETERIQELEEGMPRHVLGEV